MEIEKEVKKITLGHEIGAGASCLKCKDKCEGFELHFWRKICRNCKCGLEDHDVQLETEEDKKVGKLFEDTKYTGLIAKLKRDGIPSYRGNQFTISVQSPTISTATPFSAGTFIPAGQAYSPSAQSVHAPHAASGPGGHISSAPGGGHTAVLGAGGQYPSAPGGGGHTAAPGAGGHYPSAPGGGYTVVPGAGGHYPSAPGGGGHSAAPGAGGHYPSAPGGGGHSAAPGAEGHYPSAPGAGHKAAPGAGVHYPSAPGGGHTAAPGAGGHFPSAPGAGHKAAPGAGAYIPSAAGAGNILAPGGGHTAAPGGGAHTPSIPGAGHTVVSPSSSPAKFPGAGPAVMPTAVPAKTNVVKSITYEWAPSGINQGLALRYMELLPPERRPIAGTTGADYRKKQMAKQLPEHDQDPERCHELSPGEVKLMQQYVRKYKDEALGIGDITLPEEIGKQAGLTGDKGAQGLGAGTKPGAGTPGRPGTDSAAGDKGDAFAAMGKVGAAGDSGTSLSGPSGNYSCHQCQQPMKKGEPAVYADRAGYDKLWHPGCFVCCTCTELLVDMIYFWKKGQLYCGRHYGDSEKPRCAGCDELIFSNEYTQAEDLNWHLKHFCCFDCDCVLAGETYVMENEKPVCTPCYMKNHAVCCVACHNPIEPEAQRVSYGEYHWHAEPQCFQCSGCSKCLVGQRFMAMQGKLVCSVECKKKIMAS
ncbi:testin [Paramisgurnus dabryanus]|uniref:testin n=1 Tax=Paramisgurnus dabryanus TaxID=90735 RepID=UPI0031F3EB05